MNTHPIRYLMTLLLFVLVLFRAPFAYADSDPVAGPNNGSWTHSMHLPIYGAVVTSPFYRNDPPHALHGAWDFAGDVEEGVTPIFAAANGYLDTKGWVSGFGNCVILVHHESDPRFQNGGGTIYTLYGHMADFSDAIKNASIGDYIPMDTQVGTIGCTGGDYPVHLHFGVQYSTYSSHLSYDPKYFLIGDFADADQAPSGINSKIEKFIWDATFNFTEPIREVMEDVVTYCKKAFDFIKDTIRHLLMILLTIDLALSAILNSINPEKGENFFGWLLYKFILYLFLIFILANWGNFIVNLSKHAFLGFGASAMGVQYDTAEAALADPLDLIKKGASLITPIFEQLSKFDGMFKIGASILTILPLFIFIVIILGCFALMTYQIIMAYIEFYMVAVMSFVTFMFAGVKQTRYIGERGLNALFACSIKLFFFCMFSLMLQSVMANYTTDAFFRTEVIQSIENNRPNTPGASGGMAGEVDIHGRAKAEVAYLTQQILKEKYNKDLRADWIWAQMAQECGPNMDSENAIVNHNYAGMGFDGSDYRHYDTDEEFAEDYAKTLNAYAEDGLFDAKSIDDYAAALKHGGYFGAPLEEYANGMKQNLYGTHSAPVPSLLINFFVLFKFTITCMLFVILGDRLSKAIIKPLTGPGFKFTNASD